MPLVLLLFLALWLVQPAAAAPETEVYVRARCLASPPEVRLQMARLRRIPLMAWGLKTFEQLTSFRLERDLLSWWRGHLQFGFVRVGDVSPLNLIYRRQQGAPEYDALLDELRNLGVALDSYKLEKKKLPKTLEALVPEYVEELPTLPGVNFIYTAEGGAWVVRAELAPDSKEARQGKPPSNSEKDGLDSETFPQKDPLGLVVALDSYSPADTERVLKRMDETFPCLEATGPSRWKITCEDFPVIYVALQEGWLVASDDESLLPNALTVLSMAGNPRNAFQLQTLPAHDELYAFADLQEIVAHSPDLTAEARKSLAPLTSVGLTAWGVGKPIPAQIQARAFLQLEESALAEFSTAGEVPISTLMNRINWDISEIVVVDLSQTYRLLERAADAHPSVGVFVTMMLAEAQRTLGMEITRETLRNGSYRLFVSYERIDVFANFLKMFTGMMVGNRNALLGQVEGEPAPSPEPSPEPTPQPILHELPFMAGLEIAPGALQDALWKGLQDALGPRPKFYRTAGEVRVDTSADGQIAVARQGNLLLCAGGGSGRLVDRILATTESNSLTALETYRQFREGLQGQELLLTHVKVDWLYSLVKGFLLMLGTDFRPEATAIGLWRDVYGALNLEGQGVRFTGVMSSSEQIP